MKRTTSTLILALAMLGAAIAAVPAAAFDGYQSLNALSAGDSGKQGQVQPNDYTSLNAALGSDPSERSPASSTDSDPSSLNAVLHSEPAQGVASSNPSNEVRSVNAAVGGYGSPEPLPVADLREGDGFDWFDALIGALIATGLMLMALVAARTAARHRRATAESRT
jgi:hypothetical protein